MIAKENIEINKISLGDVEINKGSLGDSEVFSAMLAGDSNYGFFGEVPTSEFITGRTLANAIGLTAGTAQYSAEPWLKFALDGKVLYVAKKPYRHTISWNSINAVGAVFGTKTVVINGKTYKVRLLKGASSDPAPYTVQAAQYSEWNKLILPTYYKATSGGWLDPESIESDLADWKIGYTDADLDIDNKSSLCQETEVGYSDYCVSRGDTSAPEDIIFVQKSDTRYYATLFCWRPCLEEV